MSRDCDGCPGHFDPRQKVTRMPRIPIELPANDRHMRIEVYFRDAEKPERTGSAAAGARHLDIKLNDEACFEDCLILVKTLDVVGKPAYPMWVVDASGKLVPYH
ncbi:MAG: hypothetical protein ACYSW8_21520, partial [Planctomycetota bacterium]